MIRPSVAQLLVCLMVVACDDSGDEPEFTTAATTMSTSTTSATETPDESSSGDESSSSGVEPWEPMPYGPCEYDPSCHCDLNTCVSPCEVDAECPGEHTQCIDGGCYINCGAAGFACGQLFPDPAPNGQIFTCGHLNGIDPTKVCHWV